VKRNDGSGSVLKYLFLTQIIRWEIKGMIIQSLKHLFTRICTIVTRRVNLTPFIVVTLVYSTSVSAGVINFETVGQSMWENGNAGFLNESVFVGTEWDTPTAQIGGILGDVIQTPGIAPILITPAIPRKLLTRAIPRKRISKSKKICVFGKCVTIPAVYTPAIPAVYTPAIPAVYTPAIPSLEVDGRLGATVEVATQGRVGLQFSVEADAGSVNANVDFDASLNAPERISALSLFALESQSTLLTNSTFDTNFPELSAKAEFIMGMNVDIDALGCVAPLGCDSTSTQLGFDEFALELVSFNEKDANGDPSGDIRFLGLDQLGPNVNFGSPISVSAGPLGTEVGNFTVYIPDLETQGIVSGDVIDSMGAADFLDLKLDLDGILTVATGGVIPPLGGSLDVCIISAGFYLIDVEFGPVVEVIQSFELIPELMVDLSFSEGIFVEGFDQKQTSLTAAVADIPRLALDLEQDVGVTSEYWLDAIFENTTQIGIDGEFVFDVLKASFALSALDANFDLGELGPLFNYTNRFDIADLPPIFEESFELDGFNRVAGESFSLSTLSDPADPSPEATLSNAVAVLVTGSPVELSQEVNKPVDDSFTFSFDYLFDQAGSVLDVFLRDPNGVDTLIAELFSTETMTDFMTYSTVLSSSIFGAFDIASLVFQLDGLNGESGHTMLLDNVVFPNVENGNFDLASVTGGLTGWQGHASSPDGFVGAAVFNTIPEPGAIFLFFTGLVFLMTTGKNQNYNNAEVTAIV
jgi:hypothetical protein